MPLCITWENVNPENCDVSLNTLHVYCFTNTHITAENTFKLLRGYSLQLNLSSILSFSDTTDSIVCTRQLNTSTAATQNSQFHFS